LFQLRRVSGSDDHAVAVEAGEGAVVDDLEGLLAAETVLMLVWGVLKDL